ncbi:arginase [Salinisphaera sp. S4-8]|uniref:arginase family protein n=1 Tax=Salinisphaera sp. S4-8 TaxID=633357 RepID=UPI0033407994
MSIALTVFQGRAGDRNDLAIPGAQSIGEVLATELGIRATPIGTPEKALGADWRIELDQAMAALRDIQTHFERVMVEGRRPLSATSRCAVSLATIPVIAKHRPDACIVWFDAHGDLNIPETSDSGYLGGLALAGPAGLWDSGLGAGLALHNIILVGQRDLDPYEIELIDTGRVTHIRPGPAFVAQLEAAVAGRPVYIHLDCDVLEPGIVPTDYVCPEGLSLQDIHETCVALARSEVIGVEIAEFQHAWHPEQSPVSPAPLIEALEPVVNGLKSEPTQTR